MNPQTESAESSDSQDSPTTYREVERKLRVDDDFQLPDLCGLPGVREVRKQVPLDLNAIYHDTADLRLFRWGVTLRRRTGGKDAGWHMKLPVEGEAGSVRDEVRLPLDAGTSPQVPEGLSEIVSALTREQPLVPVVTIGNHRSPYLLIDEAGEPSAELVDDHVSIMDGPNVRHRFREIEIEALTRAGEDSGILSTVADRLESLGAVPVTTSKAATALGPLGRMPADVVNLSAPPPAGPAGEAVAALLAKHVRRLLLQDVRVRRDLPDSVHKMRVAARRLRSGLDVFKPLVDKRWARHLRRELKWIAGELSPLRDTEVLGERLNRAVAQMPVEESSLAETAIDKFLQSQYADARVRAQNALDSKRYAALLVDLVDAARNPRFTPAAERPCSRALPPLVDKAWQDLDEDTLSLRQVGPPEPWHRTRKEAKKARYAAEAVEPVFGTPAQRLAESLEEVTEILGEHQDIHVEQANLRLMASRANGPTGFSLGILEASAVEQEAGLRETFRVMWPRIRAVHDDVSYQS